MRHICGDADEFHVLQRLAWNSVLDAFPELKVISKQFLLSVLDGRPYIRVSNVWIHNFIILFLSSGQSIR